jgi:hypothetical protein
MNHPNKEWVYQEKYKSQQQLKVKYHKQQQHHKYTLLVLALQLYKEKQLNKVHLG